MAHQTSKRVTADVYLEKFTLHDKESMFRATEPPQYYLQIIISRPGSKVIAREFIMSSRTERDAHYKHLKMVFGM